MPTSLSCGPRAAWLTDAPPAALPKIQSRGTVTCHGLVEPTIAIRGARATVPAWTDPTDEIVVKLAEFSRR